MFKKVAAALILVVAIFVIGLGLGWMGHRFISYGPTLYETPVLLTRVENLKQLVTVKYVLEKVVVYDDMKWYGDSRVLFIAHGIVKAGIDLDMLKPEDIQIHDKHIRVILPPPRVTDVYLDDHRSEVVERSTGLLRSFDKDLEQNARVIALDELRRAAELNGILTDATERAKVELTGLFFQLGFTSVEIESKESAPEILHKSPLAG